MQWALYILTVILVFCAAVASMRALGKSAIIQLTPYDLETIVLLGTVLAEPLVTTSVVRALAAGVVILAHIVFSKLTLTESGGKLLLGEPVILVKHGKIVERNLERSRISVPQLLASLRANGSSQLEDVEYAILEPIGQISVVLKASAAPVTPSDLGLPEPYQGLPLPLVVDGRVKENNLKLIDNSPEWLLNVLRDHGLPELSKVMYAAISDQNMLFVDIRGEEARKISIGEAKDGQRPSCPRVLPQRSCLPSPPQGLLRPSKFGYSTSLGPPRKSSMNVSTALKPRQGSTPSGSR